MSDILAGTPKTQNLDKTRIAQIAQLAFKQPHYYESILKEAAFHLSQLLKPLIKDFDEYMPIFAYGGIFD